MFEKSSKETAYRYRLSLEVKLLESQKQYHVHLKVGYGLTNLGENKEFYFTSVLESDLDGELQSLAYNFNVLKEIIENKLKEARFLVEQLNLKLTSETSYPVTYEKTEVAVAEALKDLDSLQSEVLSIAQEFTVPTQSCSIL